MTRSQKINLDLLGFWASTLCALHCAALPILLAFSTLGSLQFLENPAIEIGMLIFAMTVALASILPSFFKKHQKIQPLLVMAIGFAFIFWGRVTSVEFLEATNTVVGGILVAISHLLNAHYRKQWRKSINNTRD